MALDQVFGLAARAVKRVVDMLGRAFGQRGDDVADIHAQRAGLDPGDDAALAGPALCAVVRLGIVAQDRILGRGPLDVIAHGVGKKVLRDVQYAIDSGDTAFATRIRDHLRWAIKVGRRRDQLKDSTLAAYAAKADNTLDRLVARPVAHPAGRVLLKQIKAWRGKFFVFLTNRDVPATNNISEREIRPSVVFRKVTNGFRSDWGAQIHAGYRSVTGTARLSGQSALSAIRDLVQGRFAVA